jgi:hypothetical protein
MLIQPTLSVLGFQPKVETPYNHCQGAPKNYHPCSYINRSCITHSFSDFETKTPPISKRPSVPVRPTHSIKKKSEKFIVRVKNIPTALKQSRENVSTAVF